jgi:hypothetical protein
MFKGKDFPFETSRFQAMGQHSSTCTAPPHARIFLHLLRPLPLLFLLVALQLRLALQAVAVQVQFETFFSLHFDQFFHFTLLHFEIVFSLHTLKG